MNQQNLPQFAGDQTLVTIKHNQPITTSKQIAIDNDANNCYTKSTKIRSGYRTRRGEFSTFTADENRKYTNIGQPLRGLVESATCSNSGGNTKTEGLTMQNLSLLDQDLVVIKNNQPITTSKQIAITFGKPHYRVIESVRNLATSTPNEFNQSNFRLVDYRDTKGESRPMYELTRDGFTLLAMGFTGKRALEFKLAYINAFNEMERKLAEPKTITVKSHTRKLPSKAAHTKSNVMDIESCGIPVAEQMPIAGAMWDFMCNCKSVAELDKRRDYMMRGIINMHAHNSMRLQGLTGIIKGV